MSKRLEGKVAVITGGGGVGQAIVEKFVREGATVAVVDFSQANLDLTMKAIEALGGTGMGVLTDVSNEQAVIDMAAAVAKAYGKIDVLVNTAVVPDPTAALIDLKLEDWNKIFAVDLVGTMLCSREVVRFMIPAKSGSIINIGAEGGRAGDGRGGYPMRAGYCSAKMGVIGLTETLSREVGKDGIRVNCVSPAGVNGEREGALAQDQALGEFVGGAAKQEIGAAPAGGHRGQGEGPRYLLRGGSRRRSEQILAWQGGGADGDSESRRLPGLRRSEWDHRPDYPGELRSSLVAYLGVRSRESHPCRTCRSARSAR